MDIYFRDNSGSRVGFVIGTDIKDNSGSRVGYIEGDSIKDNSGSRVGYIEGSNFKNNYGARVGYIEGNNIKDTYGTRVGSPESNASNIEMCAAALLLFGLEAATAQQTTTRPSRPSREKPEGVFGWLVFIVVGIILFVLPAFVDNIKYFKYTATRKEWWGTFGRLFGFIMILTFIGVIKALGSSLVGAYIFAGLMIIPMVLVSIRRMHDLGRNGWWQLIPIVGFIMCGFFPSKIEDNRYI
jgi:uncharacterized membrane protein YdcZ (DUF606 family)